MGTHMFNLRACALALLALGSVAAFTSSADARWDASCNCNRPDSDYQSKRVVHEGERVVPGSRREVESTRVVPRTNIVDHNNLIVHVRPIVRRDVIVKRENVIYKNITIHRQNNTHRVEEKHRNVVAYETAQGSVRTVNEVRHVQGKDCYCGGTGRTYEGAQYVSSRY